MHVWTWETVNVGGVVIITEKTAATGIKIGAALSAALSLLLCGSTPSLAFPVTDAFGNTCDTSQLVTYPHPPPISVCPASVGLSPGARDPIPGLTRFLKFTFNPWDNPINGTDPNTGYLPGNPNEVEFNPYSGTFSPYGGPFQRSDPSYPFLGGPAQLTLHGSDGATGAYAGVDVSSTRNSGYHVSDSAGAIAPGSLFPGFHSLDTNGGFLLKTDASRWVGGNQQLLFSLSGDYTHDNTTFGTSALTPGLANAGSTQANIFELVGAVKYQNPFFYLVGLSSFDWSRTDITNNTTTPGASGATDGNGYALDARLGKQFILFNSIPVQSTVITKAPPKTGGGYAVLLDVSGHYGYSHDQNNGFTDNTGFVFGTEQSSYSDVGVAARLSAIIPDNHFAWQPFVGVTFDRQLGFSNSFNIPTQAAAAADTFNFTQSNSFWGTELGVNTLVRNGVRFEVRGYYQASADTKTVGGNIVIKIPLWQPPVGDSGIRTATK
jgi:hypothetical protein